MAELACGERIVRCFLGEEIDRVPFSVSLCWAPWEETLQRWRTETGRPDLDYWGELGFDPGFLVPAVNAGIFPEFEFRVISEDEEHAIVRDGRGVTARCRKDGGSIPEFLDYPVKTPEDWERLKDDKLRIDEPGRITQDWETLRARIKQTGEAVQVGCFPYGVFGTVRDLMGVEELLVSFYTQPEMLHDIMHHLTTLWISLWERMATEVRIDHIHIWEDMSGKQGSLISPAMIEEFMMPCYDRIADFAQANGVRLVSVDSDGDVSELVPVMMKHGVNMFLPFEVQAGCDILEFRRLYPQLGITGGLDKRALAETRADIDAEIQRAIRMVSLGRYVPGWDHLIPPDVPWENYRYAAEKIRQTCCG